MKIETTGNEVQLLLDGEEFFRELTAQLDRLIHAPASVDAYVRLAFWEADEHCEIDRVGMRTLGGMLRKVADAGHTVQFIYWKPGALAGHILKKGWTLPPAMPEYRSKISHVVGPDRKVIHGSVQVYREEHKGWFIGTTNHQKIVIFSMDGVLTAIVGGMNLTNKSYAPVSHDPRAKATGMIGTLIGAGSEVAGTANWHDTAVRLTGPAAAAVEEEWLRRWKKRRPSPALAPTKAPAQKAVEGGHVVTILTTNSELRTREMHIREALCERIAAADRYVYLENYVLSDPLLVAALAARLQANPELAVLFVAGKDTEPYSYMNRLTLTRLVLAAGGDGTIVLEDGGPREKIEETFKERVVLGGDFSNPLRVDQLELLRNPWGAKDVFRYRTPEGVERRVPLGKIREAISRRVVFAYPTQGGVKPIVDGFYVHSKLVLVDDDTAFVGSANLSYRSMVYDGEMCARIAGAAAKDIRVALFKHFDLDYADASAVQKAILSGALQANATMLAKTKNPPRGRAFLRFYGAADFAADSPPLKWCNHFWH